MAGSKAGLGTLLAFGAAAAVLLPAAARSGGAFEVAARVHGSESAAVERLLTTEFASPFARYVVLVLEGVTAPDGSAGAAVLRAVTGRLHVTPGVAGTFSWLDLPDPLFLPARAVEDGGTFVVVGLDATAGEPDALIQWFRATTPALRAAADSSLAGTGARAISLYWTGEAALNRDLRETSGREATAAELRALPVTLGLLLLAFGAVAAAAVPVAAGFLAIGLALGAASLLANVLSLSIVLENVTSMIGLGLGIDYGLLTVSRFREERWAGRSPDEAARVARRHAGHTVAVSGLTVAIGFAALLVVPLNEIRSVAVGGLLVTVASVLVATTLLPRLLAILGPRVDAGRILRGPAGPASAAGAARWHRWGEFVTRRPLPVLLLAALPVLLLAAAAPRLSTELPRGDWLPADMESARGLAALERMGRAGVVSTVRILVPMREGETATGGAGWARVRAIGEQVAADPRVERVQSLTTIIGPEAPSPALLPFIPRRVLEAYASADGRYALIEAVPRDDRTHADLVALTRDLRRTGDVLVGGLPALNADYEAAVAGRLWLVIALVVAATLLGLGLAYRSVLVPIKAVALNLLTVAAAMGAVVLVFQEGFDAGLLGAGDGTGGVFPAIPALVFCTVFGLSMDYEVFLVARVAEARRRGLGEPAAIAEGVAATGRVITSAAAVMIAVFAAFTLGDFLLIRMLGFALAVAVLLDATLVRLALGPALLALAGRWNWWPGAVGMRDRGPAGTPSDDHRRVPAATWGASAAPAGPGLLLPSSTPSPSSQAQG